jgi:hypothetical protein
MKILLTAGPIPARLDSVKFVTNRFKGGLAVKTAEALAQRGHELTIVCWQFADLAAGKKLPFNTILVEDVLDYEKKVLEFQADAYVLAAAVANLMPSNPFEGKFPSHNYKEGDKFPVEFQIAPRVIDKIKKKYPRTTLIGYKLYDGPTTELLRAARVTLHESRANLVFANHPAQAKTTKYAITPDGSAFPVSFDEHVDLIHQLVQERFYTSFPIKNIATITPEEKVLVEAYPKLNIEGQTFGTFAIRKGNGFVTTSRGHTSQELPYVKCVDHNNLLVYASSRATLNAPLLSRYFELNPQINYLVHGHQEIAGFPVTADYYFPGTAAEAQQAKAFDMDFFVVNFRHHGFVAGFGHLQDAVKFCKNVAEGNNERK